MLLNQYISVLCVCFPEYLFPPGTGKGCVLIATVMSTGTPGLVLPNTQLQTCSLRYTQSQKWEQPVTVVHRLHVCVCVQVCGMESCES